MLKIIEKPNRRCRGKGQRTRERKTSSQRVLKSSNLAEKSDSPVSMLFEILKAQKQCSQDTDRIPGGIRLLSESEKCQKSKALKPNVQWLKHATPGVTMHGVLEREACKGLLLHNRKRRKRFHLCRQLQLLWAQRQSWSWWLSVSPRPTLGPGWA